MKKRGKVALVFMMTIVIGFLLPAGTMAGSLEPSGPPDSTMKTLDQIPPTWSLKLRADDGPNGDPCNSSRFKCIFHNEAVLDKETGLVWEQSPGINLYNLQAAQNRCNSLCWYYTAGGRCGWRIPTVQELESLIDPTRFSLQGVSTLPSGNPFSNVHVNWPSMYWSATVMPWGGSPMAWEVTFNSDHSLNDVGAVTNENYVWCVRGGSGVDAQ